MCSSFFCHVLVLSVNLFHRRPAQSTSDGFVILRHLCERTSRNCRRKLVLGEREREGCGLHLPKTQITSKTSFAGFVTTRRKEHVICHLLACHLPFAICRSGDFLADDHHVGALIWGRSCPLHARSKDRHPDREVVWPGGVVPRY